MLKAGDYVMVRGIVNSLRPVSKVTKDGKKVMVGRHWYVLDAYDEKHKVYVETMSKEDLERFSRAREVKRIALNLADCPLTDEDMDTLIKIAKKYKS